MGLAGAYGEFRVVLLNGILETAELVRTHRTWRSAVLAGVTRMTKREVDEVVEQSILLDISMGSDSRFIGIDCDRTVNKTVPIYDRAEIGKRYLDSDSERILDLEDIDIDGSIYRDRYITGFDIHSYKYMGTLAITRCAGNTPSHSMPAINRSAFSIWSINEMFRLLENLIHNSRRVKGESICYIKRV